MKIHLPSYPPGVHRISERLDPQDLDLGRDVFTRPIQADLTLDRHDPYLQFQFKLETSVKLECDRCLTIFEQPLQVRTPMLYVLGRPQSAESNDDPEISYVPAGSVEIDISTDLRDFLILSLPERSLCREDCQGLCPLCGTDWNTLTCRHAAPI